MVYKPTEVVEVVWARAVAVSIAVTFASGIAAPLGSVMIPVIEPRSWAKQVTVQNKTKPANTISRLEDMPAPPFFRLSEWPRPDIKTTCGWREEGCVPMRRRCEKLG